MRDLYFASLPQGSIPGELGAGRDAFEEELLGLPSLFDGDRGS